MLVNVVIYLFRGSILPTERVNIFLGVSRMSIGLRIKQLRLGRKWSQYRLAQSIGTNTKTVKDWENDVSMPSIPNVIKLCRLFHISSDELLGLKSNNVIVLDSIPKPDQLKIRAMLQVYIDVCEQDSDFNDY